MINPKLKGFLQNILPMLVIFSVWEVGSGVWFNALYLSKPSAILSRMVEDFGNGILIGHLGTTLAELGLGYIFGVVLGLLMAFWLGSNQTAAEILEPYILVIQGIPKVAIAPLIIIWLGIGIWSKVFIAALLVFFLIFYNVFLGLKLIDHELIRLAQVMGAKRREILGHILFPSTMPYFLNGLKSSIPYGVIGVIVGHYIASRSGLGYYILLNTGNFDVAGTFVGVLILIFLIILGQKGIESLERRVLRWQPGNRTGGGQAI